MYLVMGIARWVNVTNSRGNTKVMCSWADGMVGACPIFEHLEDAQAYSDCEYEIVALREVK